ncbi:MAG TPA: cell division protein FtsB [Chromatiales bacterium]|nr:cell division protein FtsB [Thiotrichales bacterium]HIP68067.1 cell division protein FtsB [Chromatiales bacterium]
MRILTIILIILLVLLQYRYWVGEGSQQEVWRMKKAVAAQKQENEKLQARNKALEAEVQNLKKGLDAIEERARSELGMIKEGETFYRVIEPEGSE